MRYNLLFFLTIFFQSCAQTSEKSPPSYSLPSGYSLNEMTRIILQDELKEISGVAWQGNELLAIEDESAIIYRIDPKNGEILEKNKFEKNQDIEDILIRNDTSWVLRSNGSLYRVTNSEEKESQTSIFDFPIQENRDFEAIVSDIKEPFIWLFCKACEWDKDRDQSSIFKFDLRAMRFDSSAVGKIEKSQLVGLLTDKELNKLKIQPSAAAVHPLTQEYYLLSSTGKWLMTLDETMKPKSIHRLSSALFGQPEGITFAPDGTLYISNEAGKEDANILIFNYQP